MMRPHSTDTVNDGIDVLFDGAAVGCPKGVYGSDYGPRIAEELMEDLKLRAEWFAGGQRFQLDGDTAANDGNGNYLIEEAILDGGRFNLPAPPSASPVPIVARDLIVRSIATTAASFVWNINDDVVQELPRLTLEYADVSRALRGVAVRSGLIRRTLIDSTGSDGLGIDMVNGLRVEQVLIRRPAHPDYASPAIHEDGIQGEQPKDFSLCASVIYMPLGPDYLETPYSKNACLFISATDLNATNWWRDRITDTVLVIGNILGGASSTVSIGPRPVGSEIRNVLLAHNRYGRIDAGGGDTSYFSGANQIRLGGSDNAGTYANIAIFDELNTDGTETILGLGSFGANPNSGPLTEANMGVYDWNKALVSPKWREAIWRLGHASGRQILDWNGDLNPAWNRGPVVA